MCEGDSLSKTFFKELINNFLPFFGGSCDKNNYDKGPDI